MPRGGTRFAAPISRKRTVHGSTDKSGKRPRQFVETPSPAGTSERTSSRSESPSPSPRQTEAALRGDHAATVLNSSSFRAVTQGISIFLKY